MNKTAAFILFFIGVFQFALAQEAVIYSRGLVSADITFFMKNAEDIHPNLYHDISKAELKVKTDSLVNTLPEILSAMQTFRAFSEAAAFINEGHTGVDLPQTIKTDRKAGTLKMIPIQVSGYEAGYFTARLVAPGNKLENIKITAINGLSAAQLFIQMINMKGGLVPFRTVYTVNSFRILLAILGVAAPYKIDYLDNGTKRQINADGMTEADYQVALAKSAITKSYSYNVIQGSTGYFNFRSMDKYDAFKLFCDSVFEAADRQHITKMVIDLRENSGGNSALGRYLLNYITSTPYRMAGEGGRKVSQQFKDHISANKALYGESGTYILNQPSGSFLKMENEELTHTVDMPHQFKGKVCFLTGPYTFSSANMLAATVKDFKLATIIGEPTGEPANDYGELCTVKLPNTGFSAFTSTTIWVRPNNDKNDNNPIYPDYLVKRTPGTEDNVLKYAITWLDK